MLLQNRFLYFVAAEVTRLELFPLSRFPLLIKASSRRLLQLQFVAHAMHRLDPTRLVRIFFQLGAQAGDVVVHRARRRESGVTPDGIEKFFARHWLALGPGH